MRLLTKEQILLLYEDIMNQSGGDAGIRDKGLLDSAYHAPFQTYGGTELFPTCLDKAVRLSYGLIKNHPFIDGNKRIGTHVLLTFLAINNIYLEYSDQELIDIILQVAAGSCTEDQFYLWVKKHIEEKEN